ncbi:MAG: hypothetical protein HY289_00835 [Planctomycetes bacterium]|nr:hypothetical protein [Planctomycetota bacterium]
MDEIGQAHHELDRLQGIITRHEGFIFTLRGWLLTVVGGLLAAYYTDNIDMDAIVLQFALPGIALLFLFVESRHANLVEAMVDRANVIETFIRGSRLEPGKHQYDGPNVHEACNDGAHRLIPHGRGMTFVLNLAFYLIVIAVIVVVMFSLPPKGKTAAKTGTDVQKKNAG